MRGKSLKVKKKHFMQIHSEISQQLTNSRDEENSTFNFKRTTISFRTLKGKNLRINEKEEEEKKRNWRRKKEEGRRKDNNEEENNASSRLESERNG
jgi:hypothetical protein